MLDRTDILYLVRRTPNTPLASNIRVGSRLPAHATTMGRMLLAFMPAIEIDKLYAGKELKRFSEHTATTLAALHAKVEQDRGAGIAWSVTPISKAASARPRCRCSTSPAPRSVRSTCPARSILYANKARRAVIGAELRSAAKSPAGWDGSAAMRRGRPGRAAGRGRE